MIKRKRWGSTSSLFVAWLTVAYPILAATGPDIPSREAFARLQTLIGTWDVTEKGNAAKAETVIYTMTGRGSVLVEQFQSPTNGMGHMLTAYHLDLDQLVLTHFCGAGNQPRMRVKTFDDGGRHVAFEMYDITNLADPRAYHSTRLDIVFMNDDRVDLVYHGIAADKQSTQVFQLTRKSH